MTTLPRRRLPARRRRSRWWCRLGRCGTDWSRHRVVSPPARWTTCWPTRCRWRRTILVRAVGVLPGRAPGTERCMTTIDGPLGADLDQRGHPLPRVLEPGHGRRAVPLRRGRRRSIAARSAPEPGFLWHLFRARGRTPARPTASACRALYDPARGLRCNPAKLLADPVCQSAVAQYQVGPRDVLYPLGGDGMALESTDSAPVAPRSFVSTPRSTGATIRGRGHWPEQTVLYELHVRASRSCHPGVPAPLRGTYAGLAEPAALEAIPRWASRPSN